MSFLAPTSLLRETSSFSTCTDTQTQTQTQTQTHTHTHTHTQTHTHTHTHRGEEGSSDRYNVHARVHSPLPQRTHRQSVVAVVKYDLHKGRHHSGPCPLVEQPLPLLRTHVAELVTQHKLDGCTPQHTTHEHHNTQR